MKNKAIIFILVFFFSFSLVAAIIQVGNHSSVKDNYFINEKIEGKINLSISNEPVNTFFDFRFENISHGNVLLMDLIKNNSGANYTCTPKDCKEDFKKEDNGGTTKSFSLTNTKITGSAINGNNVEIKDFSITINSNAGASCQQQLSIDIISDGIIDWGNNKFSDETCISDTKSNCYGSGNFPSWFLIEQVPYCEKIYLGKYPAFEVKAFLKYDGQSSYSSDLLKASLYNTEKQFVGSCNLPKPSSSGSFVSCRINHLPKESGDYYACISLKEGSSNQGYQIQARSTGEKCGFLGDPSQVNSFSADYNIMVSAKKFAPVGSIKLNESTFYSSTQESLIGKFNDYINDKYKGVCPQEGCIIPISFSGINQQIDLSQHSVRYSFEGSSGVEENNLYLLSKTSALINSGYNLLDIGNLNINVPDKSGKYSFKLISNGVKIFEKTINIKAEGESLVEQVYPKIVAAANPTEFIAFIENQGLNGSLALRWDFGDNTPVQDSTTNKIIHTYNSIGNYTLKIDLIKSGQTIDSASFKISVISPIDAINSTLKIYDERINNVKKELTELPSQYQNVLKSQGFDPDKLNFNIRELEDEFNLLSKNPNTPSIEYISLMQKVAGLDVPIQIKPSKKSVLPFIQEIERINVAYIKSLYNDYYILGKENEYANAIFSWYNENLDVTLTHSIYSVFYNDRKEEFLTEFEYKITPKRNFDYPVYMMILLDKEDINFIERYEIADRAGLTGIKLDLTNEKNIRFFVEEGIDEFSIPVYFSPHLNQIVIREEQVSNERGFWTKFLIGSFIVIFFTLVIYILLQEWYKRKYQYYLFKNQNDLYNVLFFIKNGKNQGMTDSEIKSQLKTSKWKNEQINYAFNKFYGKRLGMWEIPIFSWYEKRKIRKEMEKRNAKKTIL
ncbi:MAG: PKD domain-containing protein [Candidatus Pacearchaeota archaeon]